MGFAKDDRPAWMMEAIAIGQQICILERELDRLTYDFKNASGDIQRQLSVLWLRKAQIERIRGESASAH